MSNRIVVQWKDTEYVDLLPDDLQKLHGKTISHPMFTVPGGKKDGTAKCRVTVTGKEIELDYGGDCAASNKSLDIGVTRFRLGNTGAVTVDWRWENEREFELCVGVALFEVDLKAMCAAVTTGI